MIFISPLLISENLNSDLLTPKHTRKLAPEFLFPCPTTMLFLLPTKTVKISLISKLKREGPELFNHPGNVNIYFI